jgi:hypothetical protein
MVPDAEMEVREGGEEGKKGRRVGEGGIRSSIKG